MVLSKAYSNVHDLTFLFVTTSLTRLISGSAFTVNRFWFRGSALGFRVSGLGFRIQGLGFGVSGSVFRVSGSGFQG